MSRATICAGKLTGIRGGARGPTANAPAPARPHGARDTGARAHGSGRARL